MIVTGAVSGPNAGATFIGAGSVGMDVAALVGGDAGDLAAEHAETISATMLMSIITAAPRDNFLGRKFRFLFIDSASEI